MKSYVKLNPLQNAFYYFASIIGLAPFSIKNNSLHPAGFLRKSYAVILAALSLLWIVTVYAYGRPATSYNKSVNDFVFVTHLVLYAAYGASSILTFAFKSKKMVEIWNRITAVRNELKNLGVEDDPGKSCNNNAKIVITNSVVLLMRVIIYIAVNRDDRDMKSKALFWFGSILLSIHFHNATLIFVQTIICMSNLFELLNKKLQGTVRKNYYNDHRNAWVTTVGGIGRIADQSSRRIAAERGNIKLSMGDVKSIAKLHRELRELVESTTQLYTIPILLAILQHVSRLLTNCYAMYKHLFVSRYAVDYGEDIVSFVAQLLARTTIAMVEVFLIAHAGTTIRKVGNATKTVLHRAWNEFYPEEMRVEFAEFSLRLLQEPVTVTAFGFFHLDYSYVYKIFCTVVAYFIIMIQLDTSQSTGGT